MRDGAFTGTDPQVLLTICRLSLSCLLKPFQRQQNLAWCGLCDPYMKKDTT